MNTKQGLRIGALAGLLVAGGATLAAAAPISGAGQYGQFTGEVTYSAESNTKAALTIKLTNTSPMGNGGYITAFVLNNPSNRITGISQLADARGGGTFELIGLGNDFVAAAPHGRFDFGASTGHSFEGGGKPQLGIGVGASDTFTFHLTGTDLLSLGADSFLTTLSSGNGAGQGYAAFDVRFRGFENGQSDKVVFTGTTPGTTPGTGTPGGATAVPEPGSIALLGTGLAALGLAWRRRMRA